jgi:integrase
MEGMTPEMRGDGTVYRHKNSKFWWISYWRGTQRRRESSKSEDFQTARALLNLRRAGITPAVDLPTSTPETVTIQELIDDLLNWYLSENPRPKFHKATESQWNHHLKNFTFQLPDGESIRFADLKAAELGTQHLRAYRVKRTQEKAAFATINRELQVIRKACKLAAESEPPKIMRIPKFKGAIGKEKNARKVFIDVAVAQKLRDAAAKEGLWARVFIEVAFTLGWRRTEIQNLRVGNVRLAENTFRIEDSKSGEPREVPMPEALRVLIQPLVLGRNSEEPLWPVKQFRYAWKRICKSAGVKSGKVGGYILHDARRSSARNKRASGVSESVIMDIQGWKTAEMFRRYGIVDQADRLRAFTQESAFLSEAEMRLQQAKQIEMFRTAEPSLAITKPPKPTVTDDAVTHVSPAKTPKAN